MPHENKEKAPHDLTRLSAARFDHHFARHLPGENGPPRQARAVHEACWSHVEPQAVAAPQLLAWSAELAETLGIASPDLAALGGHKEHGSSDSGYAGEIAHILSGNRLLPGMQPLAACYGGHQFGQWAGQLGDGRAILLGDLVAPDGQRWEIQLKGAGLTPYSRSADGRAVLRSSLREYVCSEAMYHLGVPTTRALALVGTGESVVRDMFYDGHPAAEPGAIVTRVSPSFVRFGNFEIFAARGDHERMRLLADYVITRHFPEIDPAAPDRYVQWFAEVAERTAILMAHWLRVGFVHGVMNTDNLSILGLTIDYGPFGWLDVFEPDFTPNTTDRQGRYAYAEQPAIAHWNLQRLAEALMPLCANLNAPDALEAEVERFASRFTTHWRAQSLAKIGLEDDPEIAEETLFAELLGVLAMTEVDTTRFFRALMDIAPHAPLPANGLPPLLHESFYTPADDDSLPPSFVRRLREWLKAYKRRLKSSGVDEATRRQRMAQANPCIIPRNYLLQEAINAASTGDLAPLSELMRALRTPYLEPTASPRFTERRPDWASNAPGCSALSCSS